MYNISFVTDFDGTITDDDFFGYVKNAYFDDEVLEPWRRYLAGEMSHFDALKQIYGTLRVSESDLEELVKKVTLDEWAIPTFKLCYEAQIPIFIASAGCDYYINMLIGAEIEKYNIKLITNTGTYSKDSGLLMEKPTKNNLFYDENVGISKGKIVKNIRDNGRFVVFAGDGPPDIEPARYANVVFAKKFLLDKCIKEDIRIEKFDSYKDIFLYFERVIQNGNN